MDLLSHLENVTLRRYLMPRVAIPNDQLAEAELSICILCDTTIVRTKRKLHLAWSPWWHTKNGNTHCDYQR
jgi:hypothetical protein